MLFFRLFGLKRAFEIVTIVVFLSFTRHKIFMVPKIWFRNSHPRFGWSVLSFHICILHWTTASTWNVSSQLMRWDEMEECSMKGRQQPKLSSTIINGVYFTFYGLQHAKCQTRFGLKAIFRHMWWARALAHFTGTNEFSPMIFPFFSTRINHVVNVEVCPHPLLLLLDCKCGWWWGCLSSQLFTDISE